MATLSGFAAEFYREHTAHHVDPTYFAPTSRKLLAVSVAGLAAGLVASAIAGPRLGVSFALGFAGTYGGYELLHRRIHTHAPTGPYGRWRRRHHWHHHRRPQSNHGVTSPLWDLLFTTHVDPGQIRLTRAIAPAWMLDASRRDQAPLPGRLRAVTLRPVSSGVRGRGPRPPAARRARSPRAAARAARGAGRERPGR